MTEYFGKTAEDRSHRRLVGTILIVENMKVVEREEGNMSGLYTFHRSPKISSLALQKTKPCGAEKRS